MISQSGNEKKTGGRHNLMDVRDEILRPEERTFFENSHPLDFLAVLRNMCSSHHGRNGVSMESDDNYDCLPYVFKWRWVPTEDSPPL